MEGGRREEAVGLEGAQDGEMGGAGGGEEGCTGRQKGEVSARRSRGWGWGEGSRARAGGGGNQGPGVQRWVAGGGGAGDSSCRGVASPLRVGLTFSSRTDPAYLAGRLLCDCRPAVGAAALDRTRAHRRSARQPAHRGPDQVQQRLVSRVWGGERGLLPGMAQAGGRRTEKARGQPQWDASGWLVFGVAGR